MTVFVVVAHLVGCLFFPFFFFWEAGGGEVRHTHLLVSARRQTAEIRDLEPGGDGAALFLCLQFSIPGREAEVENEESSLTVPLTSASDSSTRSKDYSWLRL